MFKDKSKEELINEFVSTLAKTNRGFNFYVDWTKCANYKEFEIELNAMNALIHADDQKSIFYLLAEKIPNFVSTFPLLFALSSDERGKLKKGKSELEILSNSLGSCDNFIIGFKENKDNHKLKTEEIEKYYDFYCQMGLDELFKNMLEKSVIDYVIGVLVGMDTNARKNRGGYLFENAVYPIIAEICNKYNLELLFQKYFSALKIDGFDINGSFAKRRADFLIIKNNKAMNIEVDFFGSSGSKPEEIIPSYIERKGELKKQGIGFAMITDGKCWNNNKKASLINGFDKIVYILNYHSAKYGYLEEIIKDYFDIR